MQIEKRNELVAVLGPIIRKRDLDKLRMLVIMEIDDEKKAILKKVHKILKSDSDLVGMYYFVKQELKLQKRFDKENKSVLLILGRILQKEIKKAEVLAKRAIK